MGWYGSATGDWNSCSCDGKIYIYIKIPLSLVLNFIATRDGEMERWRDGKMERWRDGEMQGWKDEGRGDGQMSDGEMEK